MEYKSIKVIEPLPMCSVCKKNHVCYLSDTESGVVIDVFTKCRNCLMLPVTFHLLTDQIEITEQEMADQMMNASNKIERELTGRGERN